MEINQLNKNGLRQGYWEIYWNNDNCHYKGKYDNNGKKEGYWEYYYNNGKLCIKEFNFN